MNTKENSRQIGVAIVGVGGAVATTAIAGIALLRQKAIGTEGLPLATLDPALAAMLVSYEDLVFGGWDLNAASLAEAAAGHRVLTESQLTKSWDDLAKIVPWPAVGKCPVLPEHRRFAHDCCAGPSRGNRDHPGKSP